MQGKLEMQSKFPYQENHDKYIWLDFPKIEMIEGEGAILIFSTTLNAGLGKSSVADRSIPDVAFR